VSDDGDEDEEEGDEDEVEEEEDEHLPPPACPPEFDALDSLKLFSVSRSQTMNHGRGRNE